MWKYDVNKVKRKTTVKLTKTCAYDFKFLCPFVIQKKVLNNSVESLHKLFKQFDRFDRDLLMIFRIKVILKTTNQDIM